MPNAAKPASSGDPFGDRFWSKKLKVDVENDSRFHVKKSIENYGKRLPNNGKMDAELMYF